MAKEPCFARLRLDLLVTHLDLTIDDQCWEAADEIGALALSTVHERVLFALGGEVLLLLGAPRARIGAVHRNAWALRRTVLCWRHKLGLMGHAGIRDVVALGTQPPLVHVKAQNTDDDGECHAHDDRIAIHIYWYRVKKILQRWRTEYFYIFINYVITRNTG